MNSKDLMEQREMKVREDAPSMEAEKSLSDVEGHPIVTDKFELRQKSERINPNDEEEIKRIVGILGETMQEYKGVGISAPQIGIKKRVCMINAKKLRYFVNPEIIEERGLTAYGEGCLSFPGETISTRRSVQVVVDADNLDEPATIGPEPGSDYPIDSDDLLESVTIQHELDHLDGVLMHDRDWHRKEPYTNDEMDDIGRNERVNITNGEETKNIKFKYAEKMLKNGWRLLSIDN